MDPDVKHPRAVDPDLLESGTLELVGSQFISSIPDTRGPLRNTRSGSTVPFFVVFLLRFEAKFYFPSDFSRLVYSVN